MRGPDSLQQHLRKSAIHDSDELTSNLHPSQLGRDGGIERAMITTRACKAAPHQSTAQTTPLKLSSDASHAIEALKIEALEHIEKRVLQSNTVRLVQWPILPTEQPSQPTLGGLLDRGLATNSVG